MSKQVDPWRLVIKDDKTNIYNYLTENSTDVNRRITMENNLNILQVAVSEQKREIYNMILKHPNIEVDRGDLFGKTALHYAAANGDQSACLDLLKAGADANKANIAGETAFMKACYFVEKDLLEWMVVNIPNLDVNCTDCMGRTALDILKSNLNLRDDIPPNDPKLTNILNLIHQKMTNNNAQMLQNENWLNNSTEQQTIENQIMGNADQVQQQPPTSNDAMCEENK